MNLLKVARWQFHQSVLSKQFLVMAFFIPLIFALVALGIAWAKGSDPAAGGGEPLPPFAIAVFLAILLFLGAFLSAVMTLYGVIREKGSRVVEIILSSVSAADLLGGTILGLGLAGLLQVMIWVALAYFAGSRFVPISLSVLSPVQLVCYPILFALGYLLIASLYATVGAGMKDVHSGGAAGLVGMIPYAPMLFTVAIVEHPDATWIRAASFFPPFTPAMLMMRLAVTKIPWWEVAGALCILATSVVLLMRFSARVFETAILMYGKNATLKELWRWGVRRR
ncbi:MAG: ABC transporter permease [Candidatus Bipolaricaulota bacterium]|nr:MAG: ABC transporter permease [Candidatus Bipolaricaulota bacterium]